jgi:hypothetical protein
MQCPLCDNTELKKLGKTYNGNSKYLCTVCHAVFTEGNKTICLPTINFLSFKKNKFFKRIVNYGFNQTLNLKYLFFKEIPKFQLKKSLILEVLVIALFWCISLSISSPVLNRTLETHHEWLMVHSLVSLRAFEQWGFSHLLGASILIPKSIEYSQVDITTLNKGDGIYLSYPSLWLAIPYAVFKILSIPISNFNLQVYHLLVNRLFTSIIIYFLLLEIIKVLSQDKFLNGLASKIIALTATLSWMFNPPVLYWTQNVYFCDQAVLFPIYSILLFALKNRFKFDYLSKFQQSILFFLCLLAAGFDWYGWIFLFLLILIVIIPLIKQDIWTGIDSVKPIILAILVITSWFVGQLFYYKSGWQQIIDIFLYRTGYREHLHLSQSLQIIISYWVNYLPDPIREMIGDGAMGIVIVSFLLWLLLIPLFWLYWCSDKFRDILLTYLLLLAAPLIQIIILRQHSIEHDFSTFKLALPTTFILWVVIPIWILKLLNPLYKFIPLISWIVIFLIITTNIIVNNNIQLKFVRFAWDGPEYPKEVGSIIQKYVAVNDLPLSDSEYISTNTWPPQKLWYTNRFVYTTLESPKLSQKLNFNLKQLHPVFLAYEDEISSQQVQTICKDKWQSILETVRGKKVHLCRSDVLQEFL